MAAKTLFVVVALVMATVSANPDCRTMVGDRSFNITNLCGKTLNIIYSANPQSAECIISSHTCNSDNTVSIFTTFYNNGEVNRTSNIIAKDVGPGRVERTLQGVGNTSPVTQIILSYGEFADGKVKFSSAFCRSGESDAFGKVLAANYDKADFTDELKTMKGYYTTGPNLALLPNRCGKKPY